MVFPVVGGDGKPTGYDIDNSLRFNDDDSPRLSRTVGTPTNEKIYTISFWVKKGNPTGISAEIIGTTAEGDAFRLQDIVQFFTNGTADSNLSTNRRFRDPSAWYNFVLAYDVTQSTSTNRVKLYVNGSQYTWDNATTFPSQNNTNGKINKSGETLFIGRGHATLFWDGYLADFNLIDGQALDSSYFGETDDNGVWIPKVYDGTYGNNGFFLEFKQTGTSANSSGMGADTSGNDNHFSATNLAATDVTTDTPTNNFCTWNPIAKYINDTNVTFSEGNVKGVAGAVATSYNFLGTFGSANMNFYFEAKATNVDQNNDTRIGVVPVDSTAGIAINGEHNQVVYRGDGSVVSTGETALTSQGNITDGMIVGVAVDPDNNVKWYLNGTLTSTQSINSTYRGPVYMPYFRHVNSGTVEFNFGNPSFSISSGNSDANGYGNFEYSVPSGYYALCTKNLAEYG